VPRVTDEAPQGWFSPGVRGIGLASLFADAGHEIGTALLPSFLVGVLGAPPAALGLVEGIADGLSGLAKVVGGGLADDPQRRRGLAVGGYLLTALLSAAIGLATAVWQVGVLRTGAWISRGIRKPARNALMADAVVPGTFGRAYGFERAMDNLGAVIGPLLAIALAASIGTANAILVSVIPGLLAALAIVYAIRHLRQPQPHERRPVRFHFRAVLDGKLRAIAWPIAAFELGNMAATLLILRATESLSGGAFAGMAATLAIGLYALYNVAGTLSSYPAGRLADSIGVNRIFGAGIALFGIAYLLFALDAGPVVLGLGFVLAGIGIGCAETAETAVVAEHAPEELRGSAFGLLAATQSAGDLLASVVVGVIWSLIGPAAAFVYAAAWMAISFIGLLRANA
jgi:MFS family permease